MTNFANLKNDILNKHSSLSIFAQKYLHKGKDTYFILQNKYLPIYEDSFGVKILRDDCALSKYKSLIFGHCYNFYLQFPIKQYLFFFLNALYEQQHTCMQCQKYIGISKCIKCIQLGMSRSILVFKYKYQLKYGIYKM